MNFSKPGFGAGATFFLFFFSFRCAAQQQATTQTDRSEVLLFAALATGETRYARDLFFCFRACANRSRKETRSLNGFVRFSLFLVFYLRACFFPPSNKRIGYIYLSRLTVNRVEKDNGGDLLYRSSEKKKTMLRVFNQEQRHGDYMEIFDIIVNRGYNK